MNSFQATTLQYLHAHVLNFAWNSIIWRESGGTWNRVYLSKMCQYLPYTKNMLHMYIVCCTELHLWQFAITEVEKYYSLRLDATNAATLAFSQDTCRRTLIIRVVFGVCKSRAVTCYIRDTVFRHQTKCDIIGIFIIFDWSDKDDIVPTRHCFKYVYTCVVLLYDVMTRIQNYPIINYNRQAQISRSTCCRVKWHIHIRARR